MTHLHLEGSDAALQVDVHGWIDAAVGVLDIRSFGDRCRIRLIFALPIERGTSSRGDRDVTLGEKKRRTSCSFQGRNGDRLTTSGKGRNGRERQLSRDVPALADQLRPSLRQVRRRLHGHSHAGRQSVRARVRATAVPDQLASISSRPPSVSAGFLSTDDSSRALLTNRAASGLGGDPAAGCSWAHRLNTDLPGVLCAVFCFLPPLSPAHTDLACVFCSLDRGFRSRAGSGRNVSASARCIATRNLIQILVARR